MQTLNADEAKLLSLGIPVHRNGAYLLEPLDVEIDRLPVASIPALFPPIKHSARLPPEM